jgi:maleate cis-trans isomerase
MGLEENKETARRGGTIAGNARKEIEKETGKPVITSKNALDFSRLIEDVSNNAKDDTQEK